MSTDAPSRAANKTTIGDEAAVRTPQTPKKFKPGGNDSLWALVFLFPQVAGLLVFALLPMLGVLALSMTDWDGFGEISFVGFSNYVAQFQSRELFVALRNTLVYTAIVVPGGVGLALLVAMGVNQVRGKTFYRLFFFMPYVTSAVAVSVIWLFILNADIGLINVYLERFFGVPGPGWLTNPVLVMPSISIVSIWQGLGFNMVILLAGLQTIPNEYREAASVDGAGRFRQFFSITLPLLSPTLFFVVVVSIINSFQVFDQAFVLTQGGPGLASHTLVYHLYELAFVDFTFGASSAAAVILFAIILVMTLIQFRIQKRWVHYD
ncbi:ABC-type sugar transport systems permease component [Rubrobacter radiotolerans]|uniref:ABC-type sugar transport systems permease component n=1 Tax=Rubrobacter radiotolerans TaxID=42256 RepID=A0A023X454_RUBRA|nr:sugar ABC transporter permease [Rubrobacter radiotolerans]AHY47108.1 ABC-type sugar transport systems permease component [Rubrobacter radiotolerans]MDX5894513.1 sugar ABC transporter permease [Rubrobacter radiotolerans]SMC06165.1 multiple sugar transport system permease protein [Rubrobacter radiotolerans DSM 5868]